ncbi:MAG: type IV secretion system protein [Hyphomicrobiales bacterium]|nr:type IV secretion system protein [Hyphomicrobiales bacterium]
MLSGLFKKKGNDAQKRENMVDTVKSWYSDRYQIVRIQRNILSLITVLSFVGLLGSLAALSMLQSSKTFEPYIIQIEDKTGVVTQVDRKTVERYTADEAITRYFLVKYIEAREQYNVADYVHYYSHVVRLLSNRDVYFAFRSFIDSNSPESPLKLGRNGSIYIDIKSIVLLGKGNVQIRFTKTQNQGPIPRGGRVERVWHKIATINFGFFDVNYTINERRINPLGFQVTSYRVDEDRAM